MQKTQSSAGSTMRDVVMAGGAPPAAAAAYVFGIAYLWTEAILRYLMTNTSLGTWFMLYSTRTGDVVAIAVTEGVVGILVAALAYVLMRKRARVGSITIWTAVLIVSAIIAPLIGEIGTPFGI
jgi:FtsH-binding integral membrane protein